MSMAVYQSLIACGWCVSYCFLWTIWDCCRANLSVHNNK